jgi:hypothetical protein
LRESIPEYNLDNPSSWTLTEKREVVSESEEREIQRELISIAGVNPLGKPNLTMVWGVTHQNEMMLDGKPKYYLFSPDPVLVGHQYREGGDTKAVERLQDVPANAISIPLYSPTHLGERRFFIEQWRSAEFLQRSGRFKQVHDSDNVSVWFACRNCHSIVPTAPETVNLDIERICPSCGSRRVSPVEHRESGEGRLLRDLPREGCYDYFLRLQRKDGSYHPPNQRALDSVRMLWNKNQRSFSEKDAEINQSRQRDQQAARQQRKEVWASI